jgi:HEAT repeat protein
MKLGLSATSLISPKWPVLLALFVCSSLGISVAQSSNSSQPNMATVRRRIAVIITERLTEGVIIVNGVRAQTRTPPSFEAVEEIKRYGDSAVVVLANYLHSKNPRERGIALEFLGLLGGRRIVAPLQGVIRHDPLPTIREMALRWLTQAPPNLAQPIIRQAARMDPDERVRIAAKELLGETVEGGSKFSVPFKKESPKF